MYPMKKILNLILGLTLAGGTLAQSDGCAGIPSLTVGASCSTTSYSLPGSFSNGGSGESLGLDDDGLSALQTAIAAWRLGPVAEAEKRVPPRAKNFIGQRVIVGDQLGSRGRAAGSSWSRWPWCGATSTIRSMACSTRRSARWESPRSTGLATRTGRCHR